MQKMEACLATCILSQQVESFLKEPNYFLVTKVIIQKSRNGVYLEDKYTIEYVSYIDGVLRQTINGSIATVLHTL